MTTKASSSTYLDYVELILKVSEERFPTVSRVVRHPLCSWRCPMLGLFPLRSLQATGYAEDIFYRSSRGPGGRHFKCRKVLASD
jgi:hypothetical protein